MHTLLCLGSKDRKGLASQDSGLNYGNDTARFFLGMTIQNMTIINIKVLKYYFWLGFWHLASGKTSYWAAVSSSLN